MNELGRGGVVQSLRKLPIFSRLPTEEVLWLADHGTRVHRPTGHYLFRPDEAVRHVFMLLTGRIELYGDAGPGDQCIFEIIGPGKVFGQESMLGERRHPAGARVLEMADLLVVEGEIFRQRLDERADLGLLLVAQMSRRLSGLLAQVSELKTKTAPQRLGRYLLSLIAAGTGPAMVTIPHDKKRLAGLLGMKPETLSRAFGKLRPLGVSNQKGEATVCIDDPSALEEYCRGSSADEEDARPVARKRTEIGRKKRPNLDGAR